MNAPCTFVLKNNGISQYFDVSYLDFTRKGDKTMLKQNQKTSFSETIKAYEPTYDFLKDVQRIKFKHDLHRCVLAKRGKTIKELGTLSNNQLKQCKKACETMINTVLFSKQSNVDYKTGQYVAFVTLTLPCKQVHSDKVLRRCLTRYIENLQKTYGVKYYVWKAEAQKNGNIHFHILVDKWIHYSVHRRLWNKQLNSLGYLDVYQNKHGNRNPNTTDVHSLKKDKKGRTIKNITTYITKYMTKIEFGKRPILGKLWGCSKVTKQLEYAKYCEGDTYFSHVVSMINNHNKFRQVLKEDFFSYFVGKTFDVLRKEYSSLWNDVKRFFQLQNGNVVPKTLQHKEFIRIKQTPKEQMKENDMVEQSSNEPIESIIQQLEIQYGSKAYWKNNLK